MRNIDKTKQNLKINEIDENQRNQLFKKFTDAGGQVLEEKSGAKSLSIDREKQREHLKKFEKHYKDKKSFQRKKYTGTSGRNKSSSSSIGPTSFIFDRLKISLRLRLLGIVGFSSVFFKRSFFKKFVNDYKPSLITIQMVFFALFKKNPQNGNRIIRTLDNVSPRYYELIEKAGELYDQYLIDQIIESYQEFPDIQQPLSDFKEPLNKIYRALHILKPYENTIYNAFERALEINSTFEDNKNTRSYKNKDIGNALFFIFNKLYPRLHILFCYYQGVLYPEADKEIDNILSIGKNEKPGIRVKQNLEPNPQTEKESDEKQKTETTKKDTSKIDEAIKEGLKLMYELDNQKLRSQYDKRGEFELLSNNDKNLHIYLLFREFEHEFSFILTTNQIRYNVDYSTNTKIDYRTKMQDMFNRLNKCQESFKNYYDATQEYGKLYGERPANNNNNQYIAFSKKFDEVEKKKNIAGINYRTTIKSFMDDLAAELSILINDINSEQKFIANSLDTFEFNKSIEGEKKLNKRKIYDAIITVYNFASAFSFRMSADGDLFGKSEFEEDEKPLDILGIHDEILVAKDETPVDVKDAKSLDKDKKPLDSKVEKPLEVKNEKLLDIEDENQQKTDDDKSKKSLMDELSEII